MKILVSAGEVSGDVHGSFLVKELRRLRPDLHFFGVGSERLAAAGVKIYFDLVRRGTIGLAETFPNLLPIFSVFNKVKQLALQERPDLVLLIDSQGFNLPLAKFCKAQKIKTVYYISPQEWLWGTPRGVKRVAGAIDLIVAIFEKEYELYKAAGANVVYFGHPLVDIVKPSLPREAARQSFVGDDARIVNRQSSPVIALCPGSRIQEINNLLPVLLEAGQVIRSALPQAKFLLPVASGKIIKDIFEKIGSFRPKAIVGQTYDALNASDLAICTSGTINLEASILGVPNIMAYRLSPLTYWLGKHILKIDQKLKYFSLPNILLDEMIVPELVMKEANAKRLAFEALAILRDQARQEKMRAAFARLKGQLGEPGVISRCANKILSFVI